MAIAIPSLLSIIPRVLNQLRSRSRGLFGDHPSTYLRKCLPEAQGARLHSSLQCLFGGKFRSGVRYEKDGKVHTALGDQIVLSAGVYHTPQILMLSGIGPREELEKHDINVIHANTNLTAIMIGEGLSDFIKDSA